MDDPTDLESKEREARWQAWLAKGTARDRAVARKAKAFAIAVAMLVGLGVVIYHYAH